MQAVLKSCHTAQDLFVCAKVTSKHQAVQDGKICLVGEKRKIFVPKVISRNKITDGEMICATFPLAALKSADDRDDGLRLSVEVIEPLNKNNGEIVLSTSCDREKHQGDIALRNSAGLPTLETFTWSKPCY